MDEEQIDIPSRTYRVLNGRVSGFIDGLEAVAQSVDKILSTSRFQYLIYSDDYGSDFLDLVGEDKDLVYSEAERMTLEALSIDDRITAVSILGIDELTRSSIQVRLLIATVFGAIEAVQEVSF